jgi:Family of unknown function (DUF6188)
MSWRRLRAHATLARTRRPATGRLNSGVSHQMNSFDFSWMVNLTIQKVQFNEPAQWSFSFAPSIGIGAECPWRLLQDGRVAISSEDHLQQYGLPAPLDAAVVASSLLDSHPVTRVEVRDGTADLVIDFSGGIRLEIIPISSGYESWSVTTPSGFQVIAQGGGHLSGYQAGG